MQIDNVFTEENLDKVFTHFLSVHFIILLLYNIANLAIISRFLRVERLAKATSHIQRFGKGAVGVVGLGVWVGVWDGLGFVGGGPVVVVVVVVVVVMVVVVVVVTVV